MCSGEVALGTTPDSSVAHEFNQVGNEEPNELMCYHILQPEKHLVSAGTGELRSDLSAVCAGCLCFAGLPGSFNFKEMTGLEKVCWLWG